jgi:hypothetical protein
MASPDQHQPQRRRETFPPWAATPYRAIEMKIGEGLRKRYQPPQALPHRLLTLVMQIKRQDDNEDKDE